MIIKNWGVGVHCYFSIFLICLSRTYLTCQRAYFLFLLISFFSLHYHFIMTIEKKGALVTSKGLMMKKCKLALAIYEAFTNEGPLYHRWSTHGSHIFSYIFLQQSVARVVFISEPPMAHCRSTPEAIVRWWGWTFDIMEATLFLDSNHARRKFPVAFMSTNQAT